MKLITAWAYVHAKYCLIQCSKVYTYVNKYKHSYKYTLWCEQLCMSRARLSGVPLIEGSNLLLAIPLLFGQQGWPKFARLRLQKKNIIWLQILMYIFMRIKIGISTFESHLEFEKKITHFLVILYVTWNTLNHNFDDVFHLIRAHHVANPVRSNYFHLMAMTYLLYL